jgi:hypothetical protein
MIEHIITEFPDLELRCKESCPEEIFYITDPGNERPCCIITELPITDCVTVRNQWLHSIFLIAVDHCLTRNMQRRSCEGVLVGKGKIVFLELKLNVTTARLENADTIRQDALMTQIGLTIELFRTALDRILAVNPAIEIIAHVAMPPEVPRDNATYNWLRVRFAEKYGYDYIDSHEIIMY